MRVVEDFYFARSVRFLPQIIDFKSNTLSDINLASRAITIRRESMVAAADRECLKEIRDGRSLAILAVLESSAHLIAAGLS